MSNLLLVDDDDFVRSALSRALNRTGGFSVIPAEHGRHALELLATQPVDAILTDLQMPVMDGLTLLAELFEQGIQLPVAVMTGQQIHADLRQRLQTYGIAAVFSKPVDVVSLADELQRRRALRVGDVVEHPELVVGAEGGGPPGRISGGAARGRGQLVHGAQSSRLAGCYTRVPGTSCAATPGAWLQPGTYVRKHANATDP